MSNLLEHVQTAAFPWPERLIHLFVGGSNLHGAKVDDGLDDLDLYGVFIEPAEWVLGLARLAPWKGNGRCDDPDTFDWSTAQTDRRNRAGDVDLTLYGLRKWAKLATTGNPTALHFLFSHNELPSPANGIWQKIVEQRAMFLSRRAARHFIGFSDDQLKRLTGEKGRGKKGQRPEMEQKYGFDCKAGMHAMRLLYECKELMLSATITLPRPERELLVAIRQGAWSIEKLLNEANKLIAECNAAASASVLPDAVDLDRASRLIADLYLENM